MRLNIRLNMRLAKYNFTEGLGQVILVGLNRAMLGLSRAI